MKRAGLVRAAFVVAVVGIGLFAAHLWYQGGTRLGTGSEGLGVHPVAVGVPVSFGVGLTTRGGPSVFVESATARHSANVDLRYSIIATTAGESGIGTADGTIPGAKLLDGHGIRVEQAERVLRGTETTAPAATGSVSATNESAARARLSSDQGATWLVVTVTARRPGPWTVSHITVHYRSWWRNRSVTADYDVTGRAPAR